MKFFSLSYFAIGALAQGIYVASPPAGALLALGETFVVQVVRPNFILRATEIGLAIGLVSCPNGTCPPPTSQLGSVLYHGPFDPQYHGPGQQYENFTVQVPINFQPGPASIQVARFFLIGAGSTPTIGDAHQPVLIH
ncbi:hypothetical protein ESCO_003294 [Escovopsis weberi]|uniref:Uncharacterized protein n=1 Tax=Escovopsis weberi TaxID=150374 RepID=A0A0M8MW85_ESCWE|nr:hypothetical protein ESCO_003294 [Escovopsis weberi]